jgi:hypothetical protein
MRQDLRRDLKSKVALWISEFRGQRAGEEDGGQAGGGHEEGLGRAGRGCEEVAFGAGETREISFLE